ncbi:hypothetical protein IEN85_05000 [Pelagicoccus sp. NFK12]|uniref:TonB C-terminal domain-containing protein n=1 Tax=Pelagicoccus enzymogenes TaxID=2773457 RepID=A0A927F5M6_9BACT|nr:hypothetical protein [Pelagicoccus enzymogenes]MBD5778839.1 hypothetical protein [Pelagicoccus enzymogenes]MDQ8197414.1 hypothetical protein [Pelagicoccus enzymogenes]
MNRSIIKNTLRTATTMPIHISKSASCLFLRVTCCLLFSAGWLATAKPSDDRYEPVSVKRQVEPNYPLWAYSNGVSRGFARIAFYVDEQGNASEFMPLEYTHSAFSEELLRVVRKWKFEPAHFEGRPIKSVCRAHWEFLPARPVNKTVQWDAEFRFHKSNGFNSKSVILSEERALDHKAAMLAFPPIVIKGNASDVDDFVQVTCNFFVDTDGAVGLPEIEFSSDSRLDEFVVTALKHSVFERPLREGKPTVAFMRKTYRIPILGEI